MSKFFIFALITLFISAQGASFNCAKASTFVEHSICDNAQASELDEDLSRAYKKARAVVSSPNHLKNEQRAWLKNKRNRCQNVACLKQTMRTRIKTLRYLGRQNSSNAFIPSLVGKYQTKQGDLELRMVRGKLYFELLVVNARGHIGDVKGYINVNHHKGSYINRQTDCNLKFNLHPSKIVIAQKGVCDMGMGVYADGVYR